MYFEEFVLGFKKELVLTDVTEMIVKCKPTDFAISPIENKLSLII